MREYVLLSKKVEMKLCSNRNIHNKTNTNCDSEKFFKIFEKTLYFYKIWEYNGLVNKTKGDLKMNKTITSKQACTLAHQIRRETGCSLADAFKAAYAGNNTVNPKTSWTAEELNQLFSDKVTELLRKGYVIDVAGMSGHQGEIGKIVFKKNNNYYILIMESKITSSMGKYNERYTIRFGKYTEEVEDHALNTWTTLWINKFDTTWSLEFVKITDNYFVTKELAEEFNEKDKARCESHWYYASTIVDSKYHKTLLKLVRKQKGCKGIKLSDIQKAYRVTPVDYHGNPGRRYYHVIMNKQDKNGRAIVVDIRF